jgi:hypothetical protein
MIRHHAEPNQTSRDAFEGGDEHFFKCAIVSVVAEYWYAPDGPVRDVKNLAVP